MSKENYPLVSIITVNFNQTEVTCDLLRSLEKITYPNYEVIVVDNASDEDPTLSIHLIRSDAILIKSETNLGFAGGNNLGIKASKGDYLFFVNNDTELTENVIEQLLNTFTKVPDLGVVSPKIYYYDHPKMIQYAGYTPINPYTARNNTIGQYENDKGQYDQVHATPYAHGAAMMVSRQVIHKAGMMPEFFFLYYEELDWCEQIKKEGFEIYYQPKAVIFHKESISVGKLSALKTYYLTRNRILFMRRNASKFHLTAFSIFLILFTIPKNLLFYLLKMEFNLINPFLKGIFWNLKNRKPDKKLLHLAV